MKELHSAHDFGEFLNANEAVLLYLSTKQCSVCKVLKPKIKELIQDNFPKITMGYIDTEELQEVAAQMNIFSVPTILIFFGGREFLRKSRNINLTELFNEINRPYSLYF